MIAAHLSGITNVKKFSIVIINFIYNLGQYNLVQLIVMYGFMRNWSYEICLHMHPKSFDAGLIIIITVDTPVTSGDRVLAHVSLYLFAHDIPLRVWEAIILHSDVTAPQFTGKSTVYWPAYSG